jgi:N-acyl-D-amino-acid deacylase
MPHTALFRVALLALLAGAAAGAGVATGPSAAACAPAVAPPAVEATGYDVLVRGGTLYDGTGGAPRRADLGIRGDRIVAIGDLAANPAGAVIEAGGLAVAPGFVNVLSWATDTLILDGRAQSDLRQGVTTEIFGEGWSYGPLNAAMKQELREQQGDLKFEIEWTTLAEYLGFLERHGIAPNVASFVGATTVRIHELGHADRAPAPEELTRMQALVGQAMQEGALGVGSSLIYAPASYSTTEELVALARVASEHGGSYITHMRSEGDRLVEAVDEVIRVAREAAVPAEIYHLKAGGEVNWPKLDEVIRRIEAARASGLRLTADMYPYTAGATGFDACLPGWSLEGGYPALFERLRNGESRARILREMTTPGLGFENLCLLAGDPERVLLLEFKSEALKPLTGKTLAEAARLRGKSPEETVLDLVLEDQTRVGVAFFLMSEDNVRKQIRLPWVSFGSDAGAPSAEGVFLKSATHPRAYGTFARVLGRYVRDEKLVPLGEAIRRMSSLPAENLGLARRGRLAEGHFADVVVFDPATIVDRATYEQPHQYAVGVKHVLVNGVPALRDGMPTGALPGRALRRGRE